MSPVRLDRSALESTTCTTPACTLAGSGHVVLQNAVQFDSHPFERAGDGDDARRTGEPEFAYACRR